MTAVPVARRRRFPPVGLVITLAMLLLAAPAGAQPDTPTIGSPPPAPGEGQPPAEAPASEAPGLPEAEDEEDQDVPQGFTLPAATEVTPPLILLGYLDVGYADAEGDGTSYTPGDTRLPADYGVDTFAP